MKLVSKFSSAVDAEQASDLLEANGIAAYISFKRSNRLGTYFTGAFHVGLWVVLDRHLQDAKRLLSDPDHKVAEPLSELELIEIKSSVHSGDMSQILRFLFQLLMWAALLAAVVAFVVYK